MKGIEGLDEGGVEAAVDFLHASSQFIPLHTCMCACICVHAHTYILTNVHVHVNPYACTSHMYTVKR